MKCFTIFVIFTLSKTIITGIVSSAEVCPVACTCKWKGGKETVECIDRGIISIPELDSATQVLDMSKNNLQILSREMFSKAGLVNLQRIYLRSCYVGQINDRAFKGLTNLVELDLSFNVLKNIPTRSFIDVPLLRDLSLANNPIVKIHDDSLYTLKSIIKLDLSNCDLRDITENIFKNANQLESLKLSGNLIRELPLSSLKQIPKLRVIDLSNNPLNCNCRLRDLKMWISKHNAFSSPTCALPARLENKSFSELSLEDFACAPEIVPINKSVQTVLGENATVVCQVEAMPSANIKWYWNGKILHNRTNFNSVQKTFTYEAGSIKKSSTLILTNTAEIGLIEVFCVAQNKAGTSAANFTIEVIPTAGIEMLGGSEITTIVIGIIITIMIVISGILAVLIRHFQSIIFESKSPNSLQRVVASNEVHPTPTEHPHAPNLQESPNVDENKDNQIIKPSVYNNISYTTNHYEGIVRDESIVAVVVPVVVSPTESGGVNPDLINDMKPNNIVRPGSGEYARMNSDSLYPSGIWEQIKKNQVNQLSRAISSGIPQYFNDQTPIIENNNVNGSHEDLGYANRTFPRSHVMSSANSSQQMLDSRYSSNCGLPSSEARTLRVWQHAPPVPPPLSTLKRVISITRPTTDGRVTDV